MDNGAALPRIFSEDQIAETYEHVGVTVRLIREHRKSGKLKCIPFSNKKFGISEEAVAEWLALLSSEWHGSRKTRNLNTRAGGSTGSPTVHSGMPSNTTKAEEELAARALAQAISKKPKTH